MTSSITQNQQSPLMLPCLFMSDVDVNQQSPINFDSFPPSVFLGPISPRSQQCKPKSFHNATTPSTDHEDWKSFFEQLKDTNVKTKTRPQVTSPDINRAKEKGNNLFLKDSNSTKQLVIESDSKQFLNIISFDESSQQIINAQTTDDTETERKQDASSFQNRSFTNHKNNSVSDSCDPCSGLTDFIRRKGKKQFLCLRCGSKHSNCVKAKNQASSVAKQLRNFRLSRIRSVSSAISKKVIVICPNCGKRSHSSAIRDQEVNFYRSLTWPLPLEKIIEDEAEAHCCEQEGCFSDS